MDVIETIKFSDMKDNKVTKEQVMELLRDASFSGTLLKIGGNTFVGEAIIREGYFEKLASRLVGLINKSDEPPSKLKPIGHYFWEDDLFI